MGLSVITNDGQLYMQRSAVEHFSLFCTKPTIKGDDKMLTHCKITGGKAGIRGPPALAIGRSIIITYVVEAFLCA